MLEWTGNSKAQKKVNRDKGPLTALKHCFDSKLLSERNRVSAYAVKDRKHFIAEEHGVFHEKAEKSLRITHFRNVIHV